RQRLRRVRGDPHRRGGRGGRRLQHRHRPDVRSRPPAARARRPRRHARLPPRRGAAPAMTRPTALRARRAFTLLEVMIATAILVVTLVILTETQATAVQMTLEAERIQVATQLAQAKLTEVQLL